MSKGKFTAKLGWFVLCFCDSGWGSKQEKKNYNNMVCLMSKQIAIKMNFVLKNFSQQEESYKLWEMGAKRRAWYPQSDIFSLLSIRFKHMFRKRTTSFLWCKWSLVLRDSLCWLWQRLSSNLTIKTATIRKALADSDKWVAPILKTLRRCPDKILQKVPLRQRPLKF